MHSFINFKVLGKQEGMVVSHSNVLLTHGDRCVTTSFTMQSLGLGLMNTFILESCVAEGQGLWMLQPVSIPHLTWTLRASVFSSVAMENKPVGMHLRCAGCRGWPSESKRDIS